MKETYIVIQKFMRSELQLKGNDLLIYACIYGFSQDGESCFTGSIKWLCDWTGASRPTVIDSLHRLVETGLIERIENIVNGISLPRYKANLTGGKETLLPSKKILHHNINDNTGIKETTTKVVEKKSTPTLEEIREYCKEKNLSVNADVFFNYFNEGGWKDSKGNAVKNWKQKLLTWNSYQSNRQTQGRTNKMITDDKLRAEFVEADGSMNLR